MVERIETNDPLCLERQESRYVMPSEIYSEVIDILGRDFEAVSYRENINRTIYFNNSAHEVPWDYSLRARKYLPNKISEPTISLDDNYFVEIKRTDNHIKSKERFNSKLDFASSHLGGIIGLELSEPIRPYFLVEYERKHFLPKNKKQNIRITLDNCPNYYLIDSNLGLQEMGKELVTRLEIKLSNEDSHDKDKEILKELDNFDIFPSISKKITACNYEKRTLLSVGDNPLIKDLPGVEIESKLIVIDSNPFNFFNGLVLNYKTSRNGFVMNSNFPYIYETGGINYHYRGEDCSSEGIKILTNTIRAKTTIKSDTELIVDEFGLGCILKRSEIKYEAFPLKKSEINKVLTNNPNLNLVGLIQRSRKVVYVSSNTGRIYHISIDQCVDLNNKQKRIHQLEIEYSGVLSRSMNGNEGKENIVIKEISELTRDIVNMYHDSVIPKPLRKVDWAANN